jgi:hypothetical protein
MSEEENADGLFDILVRRYFLSPALDVSEKKHYIRICRPEMVQMNRSAPYTQLHEHLLYAVTITQLKIVKWRGCGV